MKHLCTALATALAAAFCASAKTFDWPIDAPTAGARQFTAYHGETVRFNLRFGGSMTNLSPACIYYQTNGMGKAEWFGPVPGTVFHPSNDCGAAAYRFFILCNDPDGKDYTANGSLRLLDSPGFLPNELPLPPRVLDFDLLSVSNAPWTTPADVAGIVTDTVVAYDCEGLPDGATNVAFYASEGVAQFDFDLDGAHFMALANDGGFPYEFWCWNPEGVDPREFFVILYRVERRNALGLARLEDIPDNIVTTDNIESEVARQLDSVDQVRSRRILRADGPCEYGNGWGVMIYDFTSDRRWWEIAAPAVSSLSVNAPSPLSNLAPGSHVSRTLLRTDGTSGVDRCASATWRVAVLELDDGSYGLDIAATVTNGTVGVASASGGGPGAGVTYVYNAYNNNYYAFENFRADSVVTNSQYSVTVNGLYDYHHKSGYSTVNFYSNQTWSVTLTSSAGAYETTTNEYLRVINTLDHHRFYDPGLRCTWEIAVTNGCFFAEQVSTNNLLSGGAR